MTTSERTTTHKHLKKIEKSFDSATPSEKVYYSIYVFNNRFTISEEIASGDRSLYMNDIDNISQGLIKRFEKYKVISFYTNTRKVHHHYYFEGEYMYLIEGVCANEYEAEPAPIDYIIEEYNGYSDYMSDRISDYVRDIKFVNRVKLKELIGV